LGSNLKPEIEKDLKFLRLLQKELPLSPRPFDALAGKCGISPASAVRKIKALKRSGAIRRLGVVIHHRNTGYSFNAMTAVAAEPPVLRKLIDRILKTAEVTHCYERPAYPDWPFSLYFMLHAKTKRESRIALSKLFKRLPIKKKRVLYSTREFKKISFRL
jgi:siroheme decarboxylase